MESKAYQLIKTYYGEQTTKKTGVRLMNHIDEGIEILRSISANSMLDFVGFTNDRIKQMLYADKVQNEKDFRLYHEGTHPRSQELRTYFDNWLNILLK